MRIDKLDITKLVSIRGLIIYIFFFIHKLVDKKTLQIITNKNSQYYLISLYINIEF